VVFDTSGDLFGMTGQGGLFGFGTVFELTPNTSGLWTKTILHNFDYTDGYLPVNSLTFDQSGNLYGMTPFGGSGCTAGCGVIFKLTKTGAGWQETVIHSFDGSHGYSPLGSLIVDGQGNLYGAASASGTDDRDGVVFQVQSTGSGWSYHVLHTFYNAPPKCDVGNFASEPPTPTLDELGNLYGPAQAGGPYSCAFGTIWELSRSQGQWSLAVLYPFSGSQDGYPMGGLTLGPQRTLYGVTVDLANGSSGLGTVFKLTPVLDVAWSKSVLHDFTGVNFGDGDTPVEPPILDSSGNLFGTTIYGGDGQGICAAFNGCGVIYEIRTR